MTEANVNKDTLTKRNDIYGDFYLCSNCEEYSIFDDGFLKFKFCPQCGAKVIYKDGDI